VLVFFEVATLLGLQLFQSDYDDFVLKNKMIKGKMMLLPSRIKKTKMEVDDNF